MTELRNLTTTYETGEIEFRTADVLEDAERATIKDSDKAGDDFARECRSFNLSSVVGAMTDGKLITGREAEVIQELEQRNGAG